MKVNFIILFLLLFFLSCKDNLNVDTTKENFNSKPTKAERKGVKDSIRFNDLIILNKDEAISKYGSPSRQEKFVLDDLQGEFRIGLYNFYTKQERLEESIRIDEVTWEKDKYTWITVWYEILENKEIPKDTLTWKKGTDF